VNGTQFFQGKSEPSPAPNKYVCWVCGREYEAYNASINLLELNLQAASEICEDPCWLKAEESDLVREIRRHNSNIPGEVIERKVQDLIAQYRDPVHFGA
jgi:hypothetical protein